MILRFYNGKNFVDVKARDLNEAIKKLQKTRPDVYKNLNEYGVSKIKGSINVWL